MTEAPGVPGWTEEAQGWMTEAQGWKTENIWVDIRSPKVGRKKQLKSKQQKSNGK